MHLPLMGIISRAVSTAYTAVASNFDGTNDYMLRGGDLTGNADGKVGSVVFWFNPTADAGAQYIYTNTGARVRIDKAGNEKITVRAYNSTPTEIFSITSTNTILAVDGWVCVMASWDLANASAGRLYFGDVDEYNENIYTNDTIEYTRADHAIGAFTTGVSKLNACLSEVYINFAEYIDFDVEANRRKFITAGGKPVDLGSDGSTPTGTAPIMYFPNPFGTFHENEGTGGDFTVTGALTACASSPSD